MITDEEIQKIFDWADENKIVGKRWKNQKWGINLSDDEMNSVKRGIPRDKETLLKMTHLNLSKSKISNIFPELYKLTKLIYLDISDNKLTTVSKDIDKFENLEYLDLSNNVFWDEKDNYTFFSIPIEIQGLKKLKYLNLLDVQLKIIPSEIWNLKKLESLYLGGWYTEITIPKEIGKLSNLKKIILSYLNNQELPKEIGNLSNLEYLKISDCDKLKSIPREMGNLQNLQYLVLDCLRSLNKLPKEIGNLKKLKKLKIHYCKALEKIPNEIENFKDLKYLELSHLNIKELSKEIGELIKLEKIKLYGNDNLNIISKEIGNLENLTHLDLSYNSSLKELPKEVGNLINLTNLNFSNSGLEKLPSELSRLKNLKFLNDEPYVILNKFEEKKEEITNKKEKIITKYILSTIQNGNLTFKIKTLLLKGVPGTGKSRAIENIINNKLQLKDHKQNILRINIHSASSNADLMQGIGISSTDGKIEYKEKQGLILNLIERATFNPNQPFVLVLEEIQENSLNELIGDLIYLIEDDKRAKGYEADDEAYGYQELVEKVIADKPETAYVEVPYLVNSSTEYRKMIMPDNLYIFCTSNYRDDKKVIEDNLLRRFEVLEIYPKYKEDIGESFINQDVSDFLKRLNNSILEVLNDEIHPDRFLIGHSNWLNVDSEEAFFRAFLKVVVEFKDIKEVEFSDFKSIIDDTSTLPEWIGTFQHNSYKELIEYIQTKAGYDFLD